MLKHHHGFTLIEVSLVLLIIAFTLGSLLLPLGAKLEEKSINEAKAQIKEIKQSIINFTVTNSRMPCADTDNDGVENFSGGVCTDVPGLEGSVPHVTINSPHKQDPWGQAFLYRVSSEFSDALDGTTCSVSAKPNVSIDFCSANDGVIDVLDYDLNAGAGFAAANSLAAIILSTGRNTGVDSVAQSENTDDDKDFYKTGYGGVESAMPFNDIVIWISASEIIGELINARILP